MSMKANNARGLSQLDNVEVSGGGVTVTLSPECAQMFAGFPDLLEVRHLSIILGASERTVYKMLQADELPSRRLGGRLYVPKPALIEYFTAGLVEA